MKNGIKPPEIVVRRSKPSLEPIKGKVYLTTDLSYAQIYAIGGHYAGHDVHKTGHGFLFTINGSKLVDIQPDEDSVGELIYQRKNDPFLTDYYHRLSNVFTPQQMKRFDDGEYVMWTHAGKRLLKKMSEEDKLKFLDRGAHVAHEGSITVDEGWSIDLSLIPELSVDGSNFFDLAKKL